MTVPKGSNAGQILNRCLGLVLNLAMVYGELKAPEKKILTPKLCPESHEEEHVQMKYCQADFVVKATVKEELFDSGITDHRIFRVSLKNQIKISGEFMNLSDETLSEIYVSPKFTELNKALKIGQKYVMSGNIKAVNGKRVLTVNLCSDWIQPWPEVSHRHKSALRKAKFDRGCNCKLQMEAPFAAVPDETTCAPPLPLVSSSQNSGGVISQSAKNCFFTHGHCVQKILSTGKRKCAWSLNGELKQCLGDLRLP